MTPTMLQNPRARVALVLFLALLLRLIGFVSRPIWYDEAFSILFSEKGPVAMLYGTLSATGGDAADIHPLGYYTLLWLWMKGLGTSVAVARLLSVLIGMITILLLYALSRHLFDEKTALTAATMAALLPFQVHFAQEIRMYGLLSLWLVISTISLQHGREGTWKWWGVFAISSALAQYTHHLAIVYLLPLAATPVIQRDFKTFRKVFLASLAAIIIYLPWLIQLPAQLSKVNAAYWVERPGFERFLTLLLFYIPHLPLPPSLLLPGLMLATLIITIAIYQTIRAARNPAPDTKHGSWLAYLSFAPPLLLWLISQVIPVYIERALLPAHVTFCAWLAWALTRTGLPKPVYVFTIAMIVLAANLGNHQNITYKGFPYGPFRAMQAGIQERLEPGDLIIHSSKLSYLPLLYFDQNMPQGYVIDPPGSNVDTLAPATREILKLRDYENLETATEGASRVWFVIYQQSIDEFKLQGRATHPHLEYLDETFTLESVEIWDDLRLYLYAGSAP
jgi:4-amino-4-deoxy-L-arabinose transferase-like glycosyltransferase